MVSFSSAFAGAGTVAEALREDTRSLCLLCDSWQFEEHFFVFLLDQARLAVLAVTSSSRAKLYMDDI